LIKGILIQKRLPNRPDGGIMNERRCDGNDFLPMR